MKKPAFCIILSFLFISVYTQRTNIYQSGITAQQNLNAITNLKPYSDGGVGFDNRYEGVVGSPRLFNTLLKSYLLLNDRDFYISIDTDIDLKSNSILYIDPGTKQLFALPAGYIKELVIIKDEKELIFRTTRELRFDKEIREEQFCHVLADDPVMFIKIPGKIFIEADYKGAYSADRRYDEYRESVKYFIKSSDSIFHQVQLNRKSLLKLFPEKKEDINSILWDKQQEKNEEQVIMLLNKF